MRTEWRPPEASSPRPESAGLTLGGGLGFLNRRCGLACDNVLAAEVITADGNLLACDADNNADLFWAVRGGGGNFGVVTSFTYRLHDVADIVGGPLFFPLDGDVLRGYRDFMAEVPAELGALLAIALGPPVPLLPEQWHGKPVAVVLICWTGPVDEGRALLESFAARAPIIGNAVDVMPYPVINTLFDEDLPPGLRHYRKSHFARGLSDDAIDVYVEFGATTPSFESGTILFSDGRRLPTVSTTETAFALRDVDFGVIVSPSWREPADTEANIDWARRFSAALTPYSEPGGYVNVAAGEDQNWVSASYGSNFGRLTEVKRAYDPTNPFRRNQNIPPAGPA